MPGYVLTSVAETGGAFVDFAPYVPCVAEDGTVAFQAVTADGGSGVYLCAAGTIESACHSSQGAIDEAISHPDIDGEGAAYFYARAGQGTALLSALEGAIQTLASSGPKLRSIGPLGPTANQRGDVAFRAASASGVEAIYLAAHGEVALVAEAGGDLAGFEGLPVVGDDGSVVFRANLANGGEAIFRWSAGETDVIATTGADCESLGRFPCVANGRTAFVARLASGPDVLCVHPESRILEAFESLRGVLLDAAGIAVFYGVPHGGSLGIFCGGDPDRDLVLAVGSPILGSTVEEFALNPVSINSAGQIAVRVKLAGGSQAILRGDPS